MTQFDSLYEKFLTKISEDMPVDLMPGINVGAGTNAPATFTDTANYKLTPEQTARVIDSVIDYLQTRNNHSPLPYKEFQKHVIADKIVTHSSLNPTKAVYASRVIYNAMKDAGFITDEKSKGTVLISEPTAEEVDETADAVIDDINNEVPAERERIEIPDEEVTTFFKVKDFPVEEVTTEEEDVLVDAWNKIPDNTDIEWSDLCKLVSLTKANKLKEIGAILPSENTSNDTEEGSPFIEDDEDRLEDDELTDTDRRISPAEVEREISPEFRRNSSPYREYHD